jgi:hypothetical protein
MLLEVNRVGPLLKSFDLKKLFIDELGWNHAKAADLSVVVDSTRYQLTGLAEKQGLFVYQCAIPESGDFPNYATRRRIETKVERIAHEHLIVFADAAKTIQVWQWVKRELGKPAACREHHYHRSQSGLALMQKLQHLVLTLQDEENFELTLMTVTGKTRKAFDVEHVTKRFYVQFKAEHGGFLKFIKGISDEHLERWYASVMINRLMFIYFIQKKGFLAGDTDYLRNKLSESKKQGKDRFYRDFLCTLFFDGFAKRSGDRDKKTQTQLGNVPYLNGGIFMPHHIEEQCGKTIQIADSAFDKLFAFFDQYQWHLDERKLKADDEINPDVLGYIFEKYVNQKEMGAYYTKEDITEYNGKNTIIPRLFDMARERCRDKAAFVGIWHLLQDDPDRYIYEAVRRGVLDADGNEIPESRLPDFVQRGMRDPKTRMFDKCYNLGDAEFPDEKGNSLTLPKETWREYVNRRQRCLELRKKLKAGGVRDINDLITLNLDIRQFAQDVIQNCEGPELLRAFYHAILSITILDPTCGSGAFLFAALNILEPLYEACLDRMEAFLGDLERSSEKRRTDKYADFRKVLDRVAQHPNEKYFIFRTIILHNLYGVDIMDEAAEICELRLFLKLAAQVEPDSSKPNYGIEPLPDLDFNIRVGNTLIGYTTREQTRRSLEADLHRQFSWREIEEKADLADRASKMFQEMQDDYDMKPHEFAEAKVNLQRRLQELREALDSSLAGEYGVKHTATAAALKSWRRTHKPFHWFAEFFGIMNSGGFDVNIGNPPYVEYAKVKQEYVLRGFETEECGNLYSFVAERCFAILRRGGRFGMIVQLPIVCTDRMIPLQAQCLNHNLRLWFSTFDDRPGRLFDGLEHIRATIVVSEVGGPRAKNVFATSYNRWYSEYRDHLFHAIEYSDVLDNLMPGAIPKVGSSLAKRMLVKIAHPQPLGKYLRRTSSYTVYFHNSPQYWVRAMDFVPYFWNERDGEQLSTQVKPLHTSDRNEAPLTVALLSSSLFYWWFVMLSDCRHLNMREIERFPVGLERMTDATRKTLADITKRLMKDLKGHAKRKDCFYKTTGRVSYDEFYPGLSKSIIDEIDQVLAKHYGFTDEELDFIINYDIKYRMGRSTEGAPET